MFVFMGMLPKNYKEYYTLILQELEKFGVGEPVDISLSFNQIFPLETRSFENEEVREYANEVVMLLNTMVEQGLIKTFDIGVGKQNYITKEVWWFDDLESTAILTEKGYRVICEERNERMQAAVNSSVIETNRISTANSTNQTEIIRKQTKIFWFTLGISILATIISACSLFVAYLTYDREQQSESTRRHMQTLQKQIQDLQRQQSSKVIFQHQKTLVPDSSRN